MPGIDSEALTTESDQRTTLVPLIALTGKPTAEALGASRLYALTMKLFCHPPSLAAYTTILGYTQGQGMTASALNLARNQAVVNGECSYQQFRDVSQVIQSLKLLSHNGHNDEFVFTADRLIAHNQVATFLMHEDSFPYYDKLRDAYQQSSDPSELIRRLASFYALTHGYSLDILPTMYTYSDLKQGGITREFAQDRLLPVLQAQGCFGSKVIAGTDRSKNRDIQWRRLSYLRELGFLTCSIETITDVVAEVFLRTKTGKGATAPFNLNATDLTNYVDQLAPDPMATAFCDGLYQVMQPIIWPIDKAERTELDAEALLSQHYALISSF